MVSESVGEWRLLYSLAIRSESLHRQTVRCRAGYPKPCGAGPVICQADREVPGRLAFLTLISVERGYPMRTVF